MQVNKINTSNTFGVKPVSQFEHVDYCLLTTASLNHIHVPTTEWQHCWIQMILYMTSAKWDLAMEITTAERSEQWAREPKWRTWLVLLSIPSFFPELLIHSQTHTYLSISPVPFSLYPPPVASSLYSEPLPLRSDRGQHFSIQHSAAYCVYTHRHTYIWML